jgi:AraC-like DNA-binding protein
MDVLSDVLAAVRLTGAIYFDIDAGSPFVGESPGTERIAAAVMPGAEHVIAFHAILSGSCWAALSDDSVPAVRLEAGDIVMFPGGSPNVLCSSPGGHGEPDMAMYYRPVDHNLPFAYIKGGDGEDRVHFICGFLGCDVRPFNPLLGSLPPILVARKVDDGRGWVTDLFRLAFSEGGRARPGGETVLAKLSELMFVEVLRRHIEDLPVESRGWLSGLRDTHVGNALRLIHSRPVEDWTIDRLARQVGLSRSAFADRFTHYVEISPMQYVARWRLQLAGRLLERHEVSIAQAAAEVGYESQAAFNRAFKKFVGVPPGTWRRSRHAPVEATGHNGRAAPPLNPHGPEA